jgi:chemotaxis protein CheC
MKSERGSDPMHLTTDQIDALQELINIGVGRASGVLNTMTHSYVRLQVPFVEVLSSHELGKKAQRLGKSALSTVQLAFRGPFVGVASLVFPTESAAKLVNILTDDATAPTDLDSIRIGTLTEIGNIVLNGVMGVIGNELNLHIQYSVPTYTENPVENLLSPNDPDFGAAVVWAQTRFTIEDHQIDGDVILLFEVDSFGTLLAAINRAT